MGIKNLKGLIKEFSSNTIRQTFLMDYKMKTVAIDTSIYLYRYTYCNPKDPISYFVEQVLRLLKNGITPVYIFDGKPPEDKMECLDERKERKLELSRKSDKLQYMINQHNSELYSENVFKSGLTINDIDDEIKNKSLQELKELLHLTEKRNICVTKQIIDDLKTVLTFMGIPYIVASGEAEDYAVRMMKEGYADACLSEDTDVLAGGGKIFLRNFNHRSNKIEEYNFNKMMKEIGLTYDQFIDVCILLGCDYCKTIGNIGVKKAYKFIKEYGNIEKLLEFIEDHNTKNMELNKKIDMKNQEIMLKNQNLPDSDKKKLRSRKMLYTVPDNFNYKNARFLIKNCGMSEDLSNIGEKLRLGNVDIDGLKTYLGDRLPFSLQAVIDKNLEKYHHYINVGM